MKVATPRRAWLELHIEHQGARFSVLRHRQTSVRDVSLVVLGPRDDRDAESHADNTATQQQVVVECRSHPDDYCRELDDRLDLTDERRRNNAALHDADLRCQDELPGEHDPHGNRQEKARRPFPVYGIQRDERERHEQLVTDRIDEHAPLACLVELARQPAVDAVSGGDQYEGDQRPPPQCSVLRTGDQKVRRKPRQRDAQTREQIRPSVPILLHALQGEARHNTPLPGRCEVSSFDDYVILS